VADHSSRFSRAAYSQILFFFLDRKKKKQAMSLGEFYATVGGGNEETSAPSAQPSSLVRINWADEMEALDEDSRKNPLQPFLTLIRPKVDQLNPTNLIIRVLKSHQKHREISKSFSTDKG